MQRVGLFSPRLFLLDEKAVRDGEFVVKGGDGNGGVAGIGFAIVEDGEQRLHTQLVEPIETSIVAGEDDVVQGASSELGSHPVDVLDLDVVEVVHGGMVGAEPIKGDAFQLDGSQAVKNLDAHDDQGVQSLLGGELKQVVNRAVLNDV